MDWVAEFVQVVAITGVIVVVDGNPRLAVYDGRLGHGIQCDRSGSDLSK